MADIKAGDWIYNAYDADRGKKDYSRREVVRVEKDDLGREFMLLAWTSPRRTLKCEWMPVSYLDGYSVWRLER